ncbi:low temperature requirement protein A [Halalkalicoccus jeotgali]|uniref:low temperature requirement protein A n=1 Tax=Halalkalicoccus jeotgali TaxID=413810 RepID=UPI001F4C591F|nr:low temperature requirement protein A [Halalkalicoccus jeotgali]
MKLPNVRPPELRIEGSQGRHATWLELFFDLVFVVAVAELAHTLGANVSSGGVIRSGALRAVRPRLVGVDRRATGPRRSSDRLSWRRSRERHSRPRTRGHSPGWRIAPKELSVTVAPRRFGPPRRSPLQ